MDLDKEAIRSVLRDGITAYRNAVDRGITAEKLYDEGRQAWEFMEKHAKQYGVLPSLELILGSVPDAKGEQIDLSAGLFDTTEVLLDKVLERATLNLLTDGIKKVHEKISQRSAKEAAEVFSEIHRKLQAESLSLAKIESLFSLGKEVIEYYNLIESGGTGIPTPWPTMTSQTRGWWPEDLLLIAGRLGVGKSFAGLLLIHSAWLHKHDVLICTTEMTRKALASRFLCMHLRIPYGDYMSGRLGAFVKEKMVSGVEALLEDQGVQIVGKGFDFTMDNLEAAIEQCDPEMLFVDGAYLIKNKGKDRQEAVINTFNDMKRIGIRHKLVTLATTQFNRQVKSGSEETVVVENIGITDVAGWNASVAFGLYQTDEMKKNHKMGWKPLKVREGVPESFECEWDFKNMAFGEIGGSNQPAALPSQSSQGDDSTDDLADLPF